MRRTRVRHAALRSDEIDELDEDEQDELGWENATSALLTLPMSGVNDFYTFLF